MFFGMVRSRFLIVCFIHFLHSQLQKYEKTNTIALSFREECLSFRENANKNFSKEKPEAAQSFTSFPNTVWG